MNSITIKTVEKAQSLAISKGEEPTYFIKLQTENGIIIEELCFNEIIEFINPKLQSTEKITLSCHELNTVILSISGSSATFYKDDLWKAFKYAQSL